MSASARRSAWIFSAGLSRLSRPMASCTARVTASWFGCRKGRPACTTVEATAVLVPPARIGRLAGAEVGPVAVFVPVVGDRAAQVAHAVDQFADAAALADQLHRVVDPVGVPADPVQVLDAGLDGVRRVFPEQPL